MIPEHKTRPYRQQNRPSPLSSPRVAPSPQAAPGATKRIAPLGSSHPDHLGRCRRWPPPRRWQPPAAKGGRGSLGLEVVGHPVGASAAGFRQAESADSGRGGGGGCSPAAAACGQGRRPSSGRVCRVACWAPPPRSVAAGALA
jgi:hypothetical protein